MRDKQKRAERTLTKALAPSKERKGFKSTSGFPVEPLATKEEQPKKKRFLPAEQRRKDIFMAARRVFAEKGFHKAKVGDIAARAGVAQGTVYRFFPSKAALAAEIIGDEGASGFLESLKNNAAYGFDPTDLLKKVAEKYYGNLEERLPLMRFRISEGVADANLGKGYYRALLHRLCKELEFVVCEYQHKAVFKEGDPFIFGHAFYGLLFGFLYCQELMMGKELTNIDIKEIIPQVVDIYLYGVSAPSFRKAKKVPVQP